MRYNLANHNEVAHFWANKVQEEGAGANMFFERGIIYSYDRHFAIAKHYDNNLILFTTRGYSVTTSGHMSQVRSAIPYGTNIIYCHNVENPKDEDNLKNAISDIEDNLKKAIKARQRKQEYLNNAEATYNQLHQLIKIFNIKGWKVPVYDFFNPETVTAMITERNKKADAKRKRQEAKQRKQDKLDMIELLDDIKDWKEDKTMSCYHMKHKRLLHQLPDFCRINGNIVETTQSANAPLKEVKIALKLIKAGKPVKGMKLGHYTVISYDKEVLTIGCHKFQQSELDYLMKELSI